MGLGNAVLCAKYLLNNQPFAVLLPDILAVDNETNGRNYSFSQLVNVWNTSDVGQIIVECVEHDLIENYGVIDLGGKVSTPFNSIRLRGVIEKIRPGKAPPNLAGLGPFILPFKIMVLL